MKRKPLTTKTPRPGGQRLSRGLAFEQMESRLALSATIGGTIGGDVTGVVSGIELLWNRNAFLSSYQGGFVELDSRSLATQIRYNVVGVQAASVSHFNSDTINLRDWIKFEGTLGAYDSSEFTIIPQPTAGLAKPHGGMIAIGEIFAVAPLVKTGNDPEEVAQTVRGQFEISQGGAVDTGERLSLSRARDVYFEVAARVEDAEFESPYRSARTRVTVASAQLDADEELNQKSEPVSIAVLAERGRSLPAAQNGLPVDRAEVEAQAHDVAQPLREAPSITQSPESEAKPVKVARPKQVSHTEVRDQVFQAWRDSKLDSMKCVSGRPSEDEQDDTASWPMLAALAMGGLVFSSRRLSNAAPSQQQPPSCKSLGFSQLES